MDADADFAGAEALVETVIKGLGLDPATARAKTSGASGGASGGASRGASGGPNQASWTLQRGSAAVLITLAVRDGVGAKRETFLRVVSPVMTLPEPSKREALFERLLELNASGLANAAFGLAGDRIVAVSERPAAGLDASELNQMVRHLAAVADTYDDRLVQDFGGTRASDAGGPAKS